MVDKIDPMNILKHYATLIKYAFRGNQGFYESREYLATVLIEELEKFINLKGKKILDIGGERGEFCKILAQKCGAKPINLEPGKAAAGDFIWKTVKGSAEKLPSKSGEFDVVLLRGVLQHIPVKDKLKSLQEMHRVLKKEGIAYIMIPPWYSPLSGQELKPFQIFGFPLAKHFSNTILSRKISAKNLAELGLWPMTVKSTLKYIDKAGFRVLKTTDILGRMHFLTKIPIIRELLLSVGFILRR